MAKGVVLWIAAAALFLLVGSSPAGAGVGLNVDWNKFENVSGGDWGIGARATFGGDLRGMVMFDYYFVDAADFLWGGDSSGLDMKFWEINGAVVYRFPSTSVRPYVGAGVGIGRRTFSGGVSALFDSSKSKTGWSVLGGAEIGNGSVKPFVEIRGTFYSKDEMFLPNSDRRFVFSAGLLF